jgi:hypothetical protein
VPLPQRVFWIERWAAAAALSCRGWYAAAIFIVDRFYLRKSGESLRNLNRLAWPPAVR